MKISIQTTGSIVAEGDSINNLKFVEKTESLKERIEYYKKNKIWP
jgi:hypothetical protein